MTLTVSNLKRAEPGGDSSPGNAPLAPACLRDYQVPHAQTLLAALRSNRAALDASDTGAGKMYVACWIAKQMGVAPLVIAPKSTLAEWRKVAAKFGIEIEAVGYEKVHGVRHTFLRAVCPVCKETGKPLFGPYLIRLAKSDWGFERPAGSGTKWVWRYNYEFVVFDEVHRCGGFTSLKSKLLIAAKRQAGYVLSMSATSADDPRDFKALGYSLGLFEPYQFRWWLLNHGCEPGVFGGFDFTDDPEAQNVAMRKIHASIFPKRGARLRKSEIPGFPKTRIETKLIADETGKAVWLTAQARDAFVGQHLQALIKARQEIELLKVPFFVDLAEDYARVSRVIIFVNFKKTIDALRKKLGNVPVIDGSNTAEEREDIKVRFQNNEFPVLLANIQAGGVGIGLHDPTGKVERTSLISPCWNSKDLDQVTGRPNRDGGALSQQYLLYFADTLEEQIAAAVQQGLQNIRALNDAVLNGVYA